MRPVICMITARRAPNDAGEREVIDRIGAAARAGVHLVQIRQPDYEGRALTRLAGAALAAVSGSRARVVINDRVDVALAVGAHGVHLRGDSLPAARVRAIVPAGFLIGRSVHSFDEAVRAVHEGGLDYLVFGTVFPTASKPGAAAAGLDPLARVCAAVPLPVLAIGGMTAARLHAVAAAGASGFAAIGLFCGGPLEMLTSTVADAIRTFDTPVGVP